MFRPKRPASRLGFEIAIICSFTIEADAVDALFDQYWDEDRSFGKSPGDPNAYTTGSIGRHNVVLAHMPSIGKASSAAVAAQCRTSYPNIKLALIVGVCGAAPFVPNADTEIILGDITISKGVVQYDLGRRLPERFVRKDTLLDSLGRPHLEIRALLGKLEGRRGRMMLNKRLSVILWSCKRRLIYKRSIPAVHPTSCLRPAFATLAMGRRAKNVSAMDSLCRAPVWNSKTYSRRFTSD
jgi:hypothetical protein